MRFRSSSKPRKADIALAVLAILSLLFGLTLADAAWRSRAVDRAGSRVLCGSADLLTRVAAGAPPRLVEAP